MGRSERRAHGKAGRSVRWGRWQRGVVAGAIAGAASLPVLTSGVQPVHAVSATQQVIIEAPTDSTAVTDVTGTGAPVAAELHSSSAAAAALTSSQISAVQAAGAVVVPNLPVSTEDTAAYPTHAPSAVFPSVTQASQLVSGGTTGAGIGVAVLDTGIDAALPDLAGRVVDGVDLSGEGNPYQDSYGHGTFVAGLIASSGVSGADVGEAPGANLVAVKVAGASGATDEATVVRGIDWVIGHRNQDNIRVLNLSLGGTEAGPTARNPVDRAVDAAWRAGIVVVASAGNSGPQNGTITFPGDDPAAITVGALDDGGATNPSGYSIPSFSGVGPTSYDGWYKPDLVAPGRSVISLAVPGSTIYAQNPSAIVGQSGFVGSGTSFSAAITSGAAALLLQQNPALAPDQLKAALLAGAVAGPAGDPFVDGHGLLDVANAATVPQPTAVNTQSKSTPGPGGSVDLSTTWAASTWNPNSWSGATWNGATWNGATWNGATWNGATWNGATWNGATWNGATWNGATWNGATWN